MCAVLFLRKTKLSGLHFELRSSECVHANKLPSLTLILKLHNAFDQGEQRIVLTATDIITGFPLRSALAGKNITPENALTAELLKTESLRVRVATVAR